MRRMLLIVKDRLFGFRQFSIRAKVMSSVRIAIESREITARHFDPDSMAGVEVVARRHRLQGHFVDLAGLHPD